MEHIDRMISQYMNGIYDYKNVDPKAVNRFEKLKKDNPDFLKELKDPEE